MSRPITAAITRMAADYDAVLGQPEAVMMSTRTARALYAEWEQEETHAQPFVMAADGTVRMIYTPHGTLAVLSSPYCPSDKIYAGQVAELQAMAGKTAEMHKERG